MVGIKDFFDAFKGAGGGPTEAGHWRNFEQFGRLKGTGEVAGELDLPEGEVLISSERLATVETLEVDLISPDGGAVELERYGPRNRSQTRGATNLFRIGEGRVTAPGVHRLTVRAPEPEEPLTILVGRG